MDTTVYIVQSTENLEGSIIVGQAALSELVEYYAYPGNVSVFKVENLTLSPVDIIQMREENLARPVVVPPPYTGPRFELDDADKPDSEIYKPKSYQYLEDMLADDQDYDSDEYTADIGGEGEEMFSPPIPYVTHEKEEKENDDEEKIGVPTWVGGMKIPIPSSSTN